MQAWQNHGLASPPLEYIYPGALDCSQASDSDSDCSSHSTLASTASSQSTFASAASTSMWSAPSSQNSYSTPTSSIGCDSETYGESQTASQQERLVAGKLHREYLARPCTDKAFDYQNGNLDRSQVFPYEAQYKPSQVREEVPAELRKNPRRTSAATSASRGCPPTLFRQVDRKVEFVDKLVDSATYIVEAIWPTSSVPCSNDFGTSTSVLPLRKFIEETLRRSRTSYSTLQVGLYYLILIKPHIPSHDFTMEQTDESHASRVLQCGRRMFLAALILASKWLQDRNYSARAWSKISGLKVSEINENEMAFLAAVNWKLHIGEDLYNVWSDCVMKHTPSLPPSPGGSIAQNICFERECAGFKKLIQRLTPELDNVDDSVPAPAMAEPQGMPMRWRTCYQRPSILEPQPAAVFSPGRHLPSWGPLPAPRRLASQTSSGFSVPAVGALSRVLGRTTSMSSAMSQVNAVSATQILDRRAVAAPSINRTSPRSYTPTRRSSLANTVSTTSSPESMVSDISGNSRTSSISSTSLVHNAPAYMQARRAVGECQRRAWNGQQFRSGPIRTDSYDSKQRPAVTDIVDLTGPPFDLGESDAQVLSPECYVAYPEDGAHDHPSNSSLGVEQAPQLSDRDAAFALQELHNYQSAQQGQSMSLPCITAHHGSIESGDQTPKPAQAWSVPPSRASKRKCKDESDLQENVRGLLRAEFAYPTPHVTGEYLGMPSFVAAVDNPYKRVRRSMPGLYHCQGFVRQATSIGTPNEFSPRSILSAR